MCGTPHLSPCAEKIINLHAVGPPIFPFLQGMDWVFDIQTQKWYARDRVSKKTMSELQDGFKYLLGVKYMPTGWELG